MVERVHVITMRGRRRGQSEESACENDERRSGRRSEHKIFVVERVHVKRRRVITNEMCMVERVHVRRKKEERGGRGQMFVVERGM